MLLTPAAYWIYFENESIREMCKKEMDGRNIEEKDTAFYSPEFGTVSQRKITSCNLK